MPIAQTRTEQRDVERVEPEVEDREHPHLAVRRCRGTRPSPPWRSSSSRLEWREELHRRDVGVAVDDAAGHRRAGIGLLLADLAEPRDEIAEHRDVADEPDEERDRQPPVARSPQGSPRRRSRPRRRPARRAASSSLRARRARSASAWSRCGRRTRPGSSSSTGAAGSGASSSGCAAGSCASSV